MMSNWTWYAVVAANFYVLVSFLTFARFIQGQTSNAIQTIEIGAVVAAVNLFTFVGLYFWQRISVDNLVSFQRS